MILHSINQNLKKQKQKKTKSAGTSGTQQSCIQAHSVCLCMLSYRGVVIIYSSFHFTQPTQACLVKFLGKLQVGAQEKQEQVSFSDCVLLILCQRNGDTFKLLLFCQMSSLPRLSEQVGVTILKQTSSFFPKYRINKYLSWPRLFQVVLGSQDLLATVPSISHSETTFYRKVPAH